MANVNQIEAGRKQANAVSLVEEALAIGFRSGFGMDLTWF